MSEGWVYSDLQKREPNPTLRLAMQVQMGRIQARHNISEEIHQDYRAALQRVRDRYLQAQNKIGAL